MDTTVEQLAEGVDELKEEVENTIVEFTDSLKEKLLSPQVREAIDTIKYLIGNIESTEGLLIPFLSQTMCVSLTWRQQSMPARQSCFWP